MVRMSNARSVIVERDAAGTIDHLSQTLPGFEEIYRRTEMLLATRPDKMGIKGVFCDEIGLGFYLHISEQVLPVSVLYRYDRKNVYIQSIVVEVGLKVAL